MSASRFIFLTAFIVASPTIDHAQEFPASTTGKSASQTPGARLAQASDRMSAALEDPHSIHFKILLADGTPLSIAPMIVLQKTVWVQCRLRSFSLDGNVQLTSKSTDTNRSDLNSCGIKVMLQGYRTFSGSVADGAVVKIQRLRLGEGMSISIESLSAPVSAQKAYQAGESDLRKRQWPEAVQHLRVAVTLYPKYALAWSELSRALEEEGLFEEEGASLNEARRIDPKYIKPIVQLAGLASRQHRWEDEMRFCKEAFSLYAVDFPMAFTIEPKLHTT